MRKKTSKKTSKKTNFAGKIGAVLLSTALLTSNIISGIPFISNAYNKVSPVKAETALADTASKTVNADVFSWDNATVYFLLTDRFKNGNTENDHSYNRGLNQDGTVANISDTRATFHGGDFKGITETIEDGYFEDLGVNAIWISAPYEQIHGYLTGDGSSPTFAHYSYHGYYVLDYTETDANFGTAEEFQTLVDTAHNHGLRVILDIVMNHAGYNSLYDMDEYGYGTITNSDWKNVYYDFNNITATNYHDNTIDYDTSTEDWAKWWGASWIRAGIAGYTGSGSSALTQCLAGLPDFKTESTSTVDIPPILATKWQAEGTYDEKVNELKTYLNNNGYAMTVTNCVSYWLSSWVREYGVDGFRCDTAKHVDKTSWATLHTMCTEALRTWKANNPDKALDDLDFWMTGESWEHGLSYDEYYTVGQFESMINFSTCGGGALASGTLSDVYTGYSNELNTNDDYNVLSFVSSHDEVLANQSQDMYYLGSAFLLLPGGVQIYYGDESGRGMADGVDFDGYGGAGHSLRSDMNWDNLDEELLAHWQTVGNFRNNHVAVGAGLNTKATTSSGIGFVRTYEATNVYDRVAGVVGATANSDVTIDVSSAWEDGETVVNYYDSSSCEVANGTVTFNSGANGTILIADPDGKPIISLKGDTKFSDTATITVALENADKAKISIDGGKKFYVYNGSTFTIGSNGIDEDTIKVSYEATNDKGTTKGTTVFTKTHVTEDPNIDYTAKVHLKMSDGSTPNIYAWTTDSSKTKKLTGAWPGTTMTETDSEGYYYMELDTTSSYNVIACNSTGSLQTDNISNLRGEVWITVNSSNYSYTIDKKATEDESIDNTITITIVPYSGASAPYLYVWSGTNTSINGGFPGKQLTEKDSDGNYVFTVDGYTSVSCIISNGTNTGQSGNITGITGSSVITFTGSSYATDYSVEKTAAPESKFSALKSLTKSVMALDSTEYTSTSYNKVYAYVADAITLINQGETGADATEVASLYDAMYAAKAALVLANPVIKSADTSTNTITGTAACNSTVTAILGSESYNTTADDVTGEFSITFKSLVDGNNVAFFVTRDSLASAEYDYTVGTEIITTLNAPVAYATSNASKSVTVSWEAVDGATSYQLYKYFASSGVIQKSKVVTDTYATFSGLTAGKTYKYIVQAISDTGASDNVDGSFAVDAMVGKKNDTSIVPTASYNYNKGCLTLSWDKVDDISTYYVYKYYMKTKTLSSPKEVSKNYATYYTTTPGKTYRYLVSTKKFTDSELSGYNGKDCISVNIPTLG